MSYGKSPLNRYGISVIFSIHPIGSLIFIRLIFHPVGLLRRRHYGKIQTPSKASSDKKKKKPTTMCTVVKNL